MRQVQILFGTLLLCCSLVSTSTLLYGQLRAQYTQYMLNNYVLNPGITGIEDYLDLKLSSRSQWVGIDGAPKTIYLTGHTSLGVGNGSSSKGGSTQPQGDFSAGLDTYGKYRRLRPHHGVGGSIIYDRIGPFVQAKVNASYAYHLWLSKSMKMSMGASAGLVRQSFRADDVTFHDNTDVVAVGRSSMRPDFSVGVWLYSKEFYVGAAASQVLGQDMATQEDASFRPHLFLTAAYKLNVSDELALIPSVLLKHIAPVPIALDVNARAVYANRVWIGASYRQGESFAGLAGVSLSHTFDVSYSYDFGTKAVSSVSSGSHELVVGVRLLNRKMAICPQNLW
ncbi:PorP/SprF family type IX secretion system membrane protein [Rufibacter tibetensis]|uniref:Type IX secretion system membrane protein PorP/SprF n=1 Tax=Rufibacter tibetensis TaxID=512763 RepID=A0A0P0CM40_9BACT|nr:type IX secretion system membrane protein PorP/SprF [Rufibacter tibetensis]ALI97958.1 hypothetical protein DC20_01940 [Rufibacter tibetensis]